MLKYCEAYRTMRDSVQCAGLHEERGGTQKNGRTEHDYHSSRRASSSLQVDHDYNDRSFEKLEGAEKQNRRRSISFEKEFTFSPRLNSTSVRIVKERSVKAQEALASRRSTALVEEVQQKFTFKPKVSVKSEKIAQSLKTSFLERQMMHVQRQRQKLDNNSDSIVPQPCARLSPVARHSRNQLEYTRSESLHIAEKQRDSIEKTSLTRSAPDCIMAAKERECSRDFTLEQAELVENSPYIDNLTSKRSKHNLRRHKRLRTHPGANTEQNVVTADEEAKENNGHRNSVSSHYARCDNTALFNRLRQSKASAENAIKEHKIFVCHGPYPIVRASLRRRGWIEKHFKGCPAATTSSDNKKQPGNQEKHGNEDGQMTTEKKNNNEGSVHSNNNDDSFDLDGDSKWQAGYEAEDCEYSVLSRFCRNATASLFWTCRRDDIDFKYLKKDQMANHFSKAYSFTTKVGLCSHLRNLSWFEDANSDPFFPRCYRLGCDGEREDFIEDYRITSACNILKLVAKQPAPPRTNTTTTASGAATPCSVAKSKSMSAVRSTKQANQCQSPNNNINQLSSRRSTSTLNVHKDLIGGPGSRGVALALRACQEFIVHRKNEDIDNFQEETLTDEDWQELIQYYYDVLRTNLKTEEYQHIWHECNETLQEIQPYLPQLNLDGVRNVWIVKPGAKSRGRGIMCLDRLEEILKLVSSTVKKENRWIVQKYIERPLLVYNTKFDIRQWFLVTDWNPLTLWFYKDCYLRFCSQEFTLDNFEPCIHLANNSIQKHYENGVRDQRLPDNNMWSSEDFQQYLKEKGKGCVWDDVVYPGMKQAIVYTLECCQITLEARKNSFELYGADFMLTEDFKPWLIEVNSSPAMSASTDITRKLCANVIEDTMRVVLDRREDKHCDTGRFELAFKQPYVDAPPYIGINLAVTGKAMLTRPFSPLRRRWSGTRLATRPKPKTAPAAQSSNEAADDDDEEIAVDHCESREPTVLKLKETSLVLNCSQRQSDEASGTGVGKACKQLPRAVRYTGLPCVEGVRRWKIAEEGLDQNGVKGTQLRTLHIQPTVKQAAVVKKTIAQQCRGDSNLVVKPTNRAKVLKEQRLERANELEVENHLSPRVIALPDDGAHKTILRYTDKRYRHTKTVPINIHGGQLTREHSDTTAELVK